MVSASSQVVSMRKRRKLTAKEHETIVRRANEGVPPVQLAEQFGVVPRTIYGVIQRHREAQEQVGAGTVQVSVRISRADARALDAVVGRSGITSRAAALRAFLRAPGGYLAPDEDLNAAVRELRGALSPIANNINQLVRAKNTDRRKGFPVNLTPAQERLLHQLLETLDRIEAGQRELIGHRAKIMASRFAEAIQREIAS